jgi:hypothetical protein
MRIEALFLNTRHHAEQILSLGGQTDVSVTSSPPKRDPRPKEGALVPQGAPFLSENTRLPEDVHKGTTHQRQ